MNIGDWPPLNVELLLAMLPRMRKTDRPSRSVVRLGAHRFKTGEAVYLTRAGGECYYARIVSSDDDVWLSLDINLRTAGLTLIAYYWRRHICPSRANSNNLNDPNP
jgi:hypothetical protein